LATPPSDFALHLSTNSVGITYAIFFIGFFCRKSFRYTPSRLIGGWWTSFFLTYLLKFNEPS